MTGEPVYGFYNEPRNDEHIMQGDFVVTGTTIHVSTDDVVTTEVDGVYVPQYPIHRRHPMYYKPRKLKRPIWRI